MNKHNMNAKDSMNMIIDFLSEIKNCRNIYYKYCHTRFTITFLLSPVHKLGNNQFDDKIYPKIIDMIKGIPLWNTENCKNIIFTGETEYSLSFWGN